jgi:hypothetical protein
MAIVNICRSTVSRYLKNQKKFSDISLNFKIPAKNKRCLNLPQSQQGNLPHFVRMLNYVSILNVVCIFVDINTCIKYIWPWERLELATFP